jgi:hypothetical protein
MTNSVAFFHTQKSCDEYQSSYYWRERDERVSLDGHYRLLAYKILGPLDVGPTLNMDTDVVVIANLNALIVNMDDTKLFQGSPIFFCSGFTVESSISLGRRLINLIWIPCLLIKKLCRKLKIISQKPSAHHVRNGIEILEMVGGDVHTDSLNRTKQLACCAFKLVLEGKKDDIYFSNGFQLYCSRTPVVVTIKCNAIW